MTDIKLINLESLLPNIVIVEENLTSNVESEVSVLISKCYELLHSNNVTDAQRFIDIVLDKTWEDLNVGHWSSVPLFRRYIYSLSSLLMVISKVKQALTLSNDEERKSVLSEALKAADRGLLLGGQLHDELTNVAKMLTDEISKYRQENVKVSCVLSSNATLVQPCGIQGEDIPILSCPSLEMFYLQYFSKRKPVKLRNCINHWPAITKWKDLNYLIKTAGERTVPIEVGSKYDDSEWSQKLMNFRQFVEEHVLIAENKTDKGYLAQHQLFLQIPELKDDIREPEFCCCSDQQDTGDTENEDVDINAWFGPVGTVSPLHFDPKHNLLAQVVGRKRIVLYDPKYTDRLHPHGTKLLHNTAQVDPENPDYEKFPSYSNTPALETILNPGEMLYIPPHWWHHVRSLDISFSVSFWW